MEGTSLRSWIDPHGNFIRDVKGMAFSSVAQVSTHYQILQGEFQLQPIIAPEAIVHEELVDLGNKKLHTHVREAFPIEANAHISDCGWRCAYQPPIGTSCHHLFLRQPSRSFQGVAMLHSL